MNFEIIHFDYKKHWHGMWESRQMLTPSENAEYIKGFSKIESLEDQIKYLYAYSGHINLYLHQCYVIDGKQYPLGFLFPSSEIINAICDFDMRIFAERDFLHFFEPIEKKLKTINSIPDRIEWIKSEIKELQFNINIYEQQCIKKKGLPDRKLLFFYCGFKSAKRGMQFEIDPDKYEGEIAGWETQFSAEGFIYGKIVNFLNDELKKLESISNHIELQNNITGKQNNLPVIKLINIDEEYIEVLERTFMGFIQTEDQAQAMQLLKGENISGKVNFKGTRTNLVNYFLHGLNNQPKKIHNPKPDVGNWIIQFFKCKGNDLEPSTIKRYFQDASDKTDITRKYQR